MSADTQTHTYTHTRSHPNKPPTAGVQLVGHTTSKIVVLLLLCFVLEMLLHYDVMTMQCDDKSPRGVLLGWF